MTSLEDGDVDYHAEDEDAYRIRFVYDFTFDLIVFLKSGNTHMF